MIVFGCVAIEPSCPLGEMAEILTEVFGVPLSVERTGRYEEYPAYTAQILGLELALLGVPEGRYQSTPCDQYQLVVNSVKPAGKQGEVDLSEYLLGLLEKSGLSVNACPPS